MCKFKLKTYTNLIIFNLLLLILGLPGAANEDARDNASEPEIRVAIGLDLMDTTVVFPKGGVIYDTLSNKQIFSTSENKKINLRYFKGKISSDSLDGLYTSLKFVPQESTYINHKNKPYRGYIRTVATRTGIWVINYVRIEDYLYGVVPYEVPMSWPIEAIKAQAVAARTYAVRCLGQYGHGEYDVFDSVKDQVYGGVDGEEPAAVKAVEGSRGIILSYQGWPIIAYYSADAGGQTEECKYVFPADLPYLKSVPSKDNLENHRWNFTMKKSDMESLMKKSGFDVGKISEIKIKEVSPTGRPMTIEVIGSKQKKVFSSNDFRKMIGAGKVRSTLFTILDGNGNSTLPGSNPGTRTISPELINNSLSAITKSGSFPIKEKQFKVITANGIQETSGSDIRIITLNSENIFEPKKEAKVGKDEFLFVGSGFGHGVGMSQWGARAYAEDGWDYEKILLHYYCGAELTVWY